MLPDAQKFFAPTMIDKDTKNNLIVLIFLWSRHLFNWEGLYSSSVHFYQKMPSFAEKVLNIGVRVRTMLSRSPIRKNRQQIPPSENH